MKTALLEDDIHKMVVDKQQEIKHTIGIEPKLSDIINKLIRDNIQNFELQPQREHNK